MSTGTMITHKLPEDIPDSYKLWDGINTDENSSRSPNNVWNGESTVCAADGIDIDTFYVPWGRLAIRRSE